MQRTRVKICCIASLEEAQLAVAAGADALGLVSRMPSGPGPIDEAAICRIARAVPPPIATFLLTCLQTSDEIIAQQQRCHPNTLQLVDEVAPDHLKRLRDALPAVKLVQVIHVADEQSRDEAIAVAPLVDAILLDSGRPRAAVKELGGTGRTHDWAISRTIVQAVQVPVFLAGGLNPDNVVEAIRTVQPFGVDLCGGVRTNGRLDPDKLRRFMAAVG